MGVSQKVISVRNLSKLMYVEFELSSLYFAVMGIQKTCGQMDSDILSTSNLKLMLLMCILVVIASTVRKLVCLLLTVRCLGDHYNNANKRIFLSHCYDKQ